jgi:hypothetical protein
MIINSTTNLNKLKFTSSGGDRWDQGKSGQPYIVKPIPGADDTFQQQLDGQPQPKGGVDFLLRGGLLSVDSALDDVSRLTKMLFDTRSPNGFEFIAKQNVLSRNNVKTEATFGTGYAGGTLNQGAYAAVGTLAQAGLAPIATGATNLFGLNPFTDRTPLKGADGLQKSNNGGLNSYFGVVNIQNVTNDQDGNRLIRLNDAISNRNEAKTVSGKITLNPDDAGVSILKYGGGPGSVLGIGSTNIKFADQRTGIRSPKIYRTNFINVGGANDYGVFGKSPNYNYIEESITGITTQTDDPSQVFKGNLFISGSGVTNIFAGLYPNSSLELIEGLSLNLNKNRYDEQDPGNLFNYNNSVYNPDELLVDDLQAQQQQSTAVLTQEQIEAKVPASITGLTNPSDFREVTSVGDINDLKGNQPVLSLAPNYVTRNANIEVNRGDPGLGTNLGTKDVYNYGVNAADLTALDQINALSMYTGSAVNAELATNDFCDFNIAVINNNDQGATNTYLHFRAFIDEFSDSYNASWGDIQYVGRAEKLHNYQGFSRDISIGFTVYAQSKAELIPMYKKLNYLASTLAPDYSQAGFMRGNIVKMTVGGYLFDQPGIIRSLTYTVPMESTWEIGINEIGGKDESVKQLPHMIKVTGLQFTPIQKFVPAKANSITNPTQKYIALNNTTNDQNSNYVDEYAKGNYKQSGAVLN